MIVTIRYRARLTWTDYDYTYNEDVMCDVIHEIDTETLKTTEFSWEPVAAKEGE
jgi:hypothetical protein